MRAASSPDRGGIGECRVLVAEIAVDIAYPLMGFRIFPDHRVVQLSSREQTGLIGVHADRLDGQPQLWFGWVHHDLWLEVVSRLSPDTAHSDLTEA